jgi:uncharacterized protein YecE (DUF72 family)
MNSNPKTLIGTSGFSYPEWKGIFYPDDLPSKKYLGFYAQRFKTTEINNTFYRIPTYQLAESWYSEVPSDFSFTLKLSQAITHRRKLKNADEEMERFLDAATGLKEKLGTILVQLPPYFKKDLSTLDNFLERYSKRAKLALEFRHDTWYDQETYDLLKKYDSTLAVVEAEDRKAAREVTGSFIYMRLRKGDYTRDELKEWADWMKTQTVDIYCYLKHDEKAPVLALQLLEFIT